MNIIPLSRNKEKNRAISNRQKKLKIGLLFILL